MEEKEENQEEIDNMEINPDEIKEIEEIDKEALKAEMGEEMDLEDEDMEANNNNNNINDFMEDDEKAQKINLQISVKNIGKFTGKEVVQIYVKAPCGKLGKAEKVLVDFGKTEDLKPGSSSTLNFEIPYEAFSSSAFFSESFRWSCFCRRSCLWLCFWNYLLRGLRKVERVEKG